MKRVEAQTESTFTPQGAPRRTIWPHFVEMFFALPLGIWAIAYLIDVTLGRPMALLMGITLFGAFCWYIAFLIGDYDRTGWYELKPVAIPPLPFVISKWSGFVFGEDEIIAGRRERIAYSRVERVIVRCKGVMFSGIEIYYSGGKQVYAGFDDDGEPFFSSRPIYVGLSSSSGDPARTALAILRDRAPHARFEGPEWIMQGWVPILGFRNPNAHG